MTPGRRQSSVAGLFLFRRLAERTLDGLAVPFAIALFAIGLPFIKYSVEVKQYGIDATVAILLTLLAFDVRDRAASTTRLLLVGAVGLVVIWFSQASVLVMAGIGVAFAGTAALPCCSRIGPGVPRHDRGEAAPTVTPIADLGYRSHRAVRLERRCSPQRGEP